jgi:hypothetical protein
MELVARFGVLAGAAAAAALAAACGHKGPPLAPLHLVPAAPKGVTISRAGADARLRFLLPAENANGPGPTALERVEIYAVTVAPGGTQPPNRELMTPKFLVGSIEVEPPRVEGEPPPATTEPDPRPSPGEKTTFVETLTDEKLKPATFAVKGDPAAATAGAVGVIAAAVGKAKVPTPLLALAAHAGPAAATAAVLTTGAEAAGTAIPPYSVRIYAIRGLTKSGRAGVPSARVVLPIVAPPAAPAAPAATVTETAISLGWTAAGGKPPTAFNVYTLDGADPLNGSPIAETQYERGGVSFGKEECFVVRSVLRVGTVDIESDPVPVCVTPRDTFPPAAPKGLSVVAGDGTMKLSWDANGEQDLAGYLVLRGEAPGETLQPLAAAPIAGTSFEDKTVKPGVRYVYAIVASDKATPPNRSAPSPRVEETAR